MRLVCLSVWLCLMALPLQAQVILSDTEIAATLRHGPWPQDPPVDPSNRFSQVPEAIALGARLFQDTALSVDGTLSCASCHDPKQAFTDGKTRPEVRGTRLDRNTQGLWNLAFSRWFGWGGDTDNLWAQSLTPILSKLEMNHTPGSLQKAIQSSDHATAFAAVTEPLANQTAEETLVNVGKLLAAYIETLTTGPTPFDQFRTALERGDDAAAGTYPQAAQRGLQIFVGHGQCTFCHSGPLFTNGEFHDAGLPYFITPTRVDPGRHAGLLALLDSPYTRNSTWSDDPNRTGAWAVRTVRQSHADFGTFKVPGLRGVAQTAPYMHDGSLPDLAAVADHYNTIDLERLHADGEAILRPLALSQSELDDLVAFLQTLSSAP